jgi:uncharacterized protein (TIGR00290 family)
MRLGILFSGGKDSAYACQKAMKEHEVVCFISIIPDNPESYMFHTPNIWMVEIQAEAAGMPIVVQRTAGEKEKELEDLKAAIESGIEQHKIDGLCLSVITHRKYMQRT